MDVARLNFSHGEHSEHGRRFHEVRRTADSAGRNVATLADLQGPKIRLGRFAHGPVIWATGERITITVEACPGDKFCSSYKFLNNLLNGELRIVFDSRTFCYPVERRPGAAKMFQCTTYRNVEAP